MHNNKEVMWVGVRFDPDDTTPNCAHVTEAHHAFITREISSVEKSVSIDSDRQILPSGALIHYISPYYATGDGWVDVFRAPDGRRIGFGQLVNDAHEGKDVLEATRCWLMQLGITGRLVEVYIWSPESPENQPVALVS